MSQPRGSKKRRRGERVVTIERIMLALRKGQPIPRTFLSRADESRRDKARHRRWRRKGFPPHHRPTREVPEQYDTPEKIAAWRALGYPDAES